MEILRADMLKEDRFERTKRIPWIDLLKIEKAKVLIVGAGAIGNEVAKNLVLSGFKFISVVDMDHVERSNLNRCVFFSDLDADKERMKAEVVAEGMEALDESVKVNFHTKKIEDMSEEFIPSHDIVLGALDNVMTRLHINGVCYYNNIPYIDGATQGFTGKVQVVLPPNTPCLECTMNKTHMKILEKRFSCTGSDISYFEDKLAAEITTTAVISAVQVREALKIVCQKYDSVIKNIFYYDGLRNTSEIFEVDFNPMCPHHQVIEE